MLRSETTPLAHPSFLITFATRRGLNPSAAPSRESVFAALSDLTPREREVALLCGEGKPTQDIAATLGRSVGTIKAELHSVFKKLGVRTRTELAMLLRGG